MAKNPRLIDLIGRKIGHWTVIAQEGNTQRGDPWWRCRCECGTEKLVRGSNLRSGQSISCGCYGSRQRVGEINKTHGETKTRLYHTWKGMRARCLNPKNPGFNNYGGRGIQVCAEWGSFIHFRKWAISSGYADNLTIERVDVNGNYCPENCTWIPKGNQSANRRFVQRAPDGELWWHKAQRNGIGMGAYRTRLMNGWPVEQAVTLPTNTRRIARKRAANGRFV
jgi:hypothetical protein